MTQMPPVFDLQEQLGEEVQQRVPESLDYMRRISQEAAVAPPAGRAGAAPRTTPSPRRPIRFCWTTSPNSTASLGVNVPKPTFHLLAKAEFSPYLEAMVSQGSGAIFFPTGS